MMSQGTRLSNKQDCNSSGRIKVLSFGYSESLLQKRHQWLSASQFDVCSVNTKSMVRRLLGNQEFDVLLIGHGVPMKDRNEIAKRAKSKKIRVIFLYRWNIHGAELADAVISVDGGAENLTECIYRLAATPMGLRSAGSHKLFKVSGKTESSAEIGHGPAKRRT
jgi:hypothetical protein